MRKINQKKKTVFIFGMVAVIAIFAAFFLFNSENRKINSLLDLGQKYLESADYENAILVFDQAIAIDPKCEEAYLGKAQAQYEAGMTEDAIATLEEGIANVDDNARLKDFLQKIMEEIKEKETAEEEAALAEERTIPLSLNYSQIVRYIDTENPTIQLEILGEEDGREKYIWGSSNPECAVVSETGLVTCLDEEGYSNITVTTEDGAESDWCGVWIINSEGMEGESETLWTMVDNEREDGEQFFILPVPENDEENIVVGNFSKKIYYSGNVSIPEKLQYKGKTWPITAVNPNAFMYCDKLESIHIPSTVDVVEERDEGMSPFFACTSLQEIEVESDNKYWKSVDGVLFSKDGKKLLSYPAAKKDKTYTIPKEVEEVYLCAFAGCSNLEEILVEEGNEFYESIEGSLIEKEGQKLVAYPVGNKLTSYEVPESVKNIGPGAFRFSNLEEVVCKSVEGLDLREFAESNKLKRIEGGTGTKYIHTDKMAVEICGIGEMENLQSLDMLLTEEQKFDEFAALTSLRSISIDVNGLSPDLENLGSLPDIESLQLLRIDNVKDFSWISKMNRLKTLSISIESGTVDLQILSELAGLEDLNINGAEYIKDLSWLSGLEKLKSLRVNINMHPIDLYILKEMTGLESLYIQGADSIKDYSWMAYMKGLKTVSLIAENSESLVTACDEAGKLEKVEKLEIRGISELDDISWLSNMNSLTSLVLEIEDKFNITDLTPIMDLKNVNWIAISIPKEDKEGLSDDILRQVDELRSRNVSINFYTSV